MRCPANTARAKPMANRLLVHDYVNYRLEKVGLHWPGRNRSLGTAATAAPSNKARQTMRLLGDEFESRYTEVFREMCDQLHITPQTAQSTFATIVDELFADGVRWGRVVALVAFGGSLAARCVDKEMPDLVDSVAVWVTAYMDNNLQSWIDLNDGWDGFVAFYEGGPDRRNENPWPSLSTICGYALAGVGALTLGAILSQKS